MKIETWHKGMSLEDTKNLAYWERNVLALLLANLENETCLANDMDITCGWYYDTDNNWDGWKRVLSLFDGNVTFHGMTLALFKRIDETLKADTPEVTDIARVEGVDLPVAQRLGQTKVMDAPAGEIPAGRLSPHTTHHRRVGWNVHDLPVRIRTDAIQRANRLRPSHRRLGDDRISQQTIGFDQGLLCDHDIITPR